MLCLYDYNPLGDPTERSFDPLFLLISFQRKIPVTSIPLYLARFHYRGKIIRNICGLKPFQI